MEIKTGIGLIASERQRQITKENWSNDHDQVEHERHELAIAAACYALHGTTAEAVTKINHIDAWPWGDVWDKRKKKNRLRRLAIAGALIAAEIEENF
jgi:hypothetical protein